MTDFYEGKWKPITKRPNDEQNILVSWQDCGGDWQGPYRAYYSGDEEKFFLLDSNVNFPINVEIWIEIPEFPE